MRAIIIDAVKREVREVEIENTLKSLQEVVGGYIETAHQLNNDSRDAVFVNEEGLLSQPKNFFVYDGAHQPFAGSGIIVGCDDEGETIGCTISLDEVKSKVSFATPPFAVIR